MELARSVMTFVITLITGIVLGVLFDCYRVLRGNLKPKKKITWFTDLLYWLVATAVIFMALVFSNWGELRFYIFIGILSGVGLYYNWLSLYAIRLFSKIIKLIITGLSLMKKIINAVFLRPGRYCFRMARCPFIFLGRKATAWYCTRRGEPIDNEKK